MGEEPDMPKVQEEQKSSYDQVETLEEALETEKNRSEEYLQQLKYARADVENLKKRFDRQLEDTKIYANERIVIELLNVVDELEIAVKSAASCDTTKSFIEGIEMILKRLMKILENEQVYAIRAVGETFDPEKHIAVARVEKEGVEGCTIIEEVRRGYVMKGKVIRPSMVKIVVPISQQKNETEGDESK